MPRGIVSPEAIQNRIKKRLESQAALDSFNIVINDRVYVTRDKYNIILVEKAVSQETGILYEVSKGFFGTIQGVKTLLDKYATQKEIDVFMDRVKELTTSFKDGLLRVHVPKNFKFDPVSSGVTNEK